MGSRGSRGSCVHGFRVSGSRGSWGSRVLTVLGAFRGSRGSRDDRHEDDDVGRWCDRGVIGDDDDGESKCGDVWRTQVALVLEHGATKSTRDNH